MEQKHYAKRMAILACLQNTTEHPSAETVCQMLRAQQSDISPATVYRNLSLFRQQGLIQCVATVDGVERFDANTQPHVHFICERCHAVIDLPQLSVPEQMKRQVTDAIGACAERCELSFRGLCRACRGTPET